MPPLTMVDSDTTNVCLNRESIADQPRCRVLQSQMLRYTCPFKILIDLHLRSAPIWIIQELHNISPRTSNLTASLHLSQQGERVHRCDVQGSAAKEHCTWHLAMASSGKPETPQAPTTVHSDSVVETEVHSTGGGHDPLEDFFPQTVKPTWKWITSCLGSGKLSSFWAHAHFVMCEYLRVSPRPLAVNHRPLPPKSFGAAPSAGTVRSAKRRRRRLWIIRCGSLWGPWGFLF